MVFYFKPSTGKKETGLTSLKRKFITCNKPLAKSRSPPNRHEGICMINEHGRWRGGFRSWDLCWGQGWGHRDHGVAALTRRGSQLGGALLWQSVDKCKRLAVVLQIPSYKANIPVYDIHFLYLLIYAGPASVLYHITVNLHNQQRQVMQLGIPLQNTDVYWWFFFFRNTICGWNRFYL